MIECIFTIDYEIYGNGQGSLQDLVFEPAEELRKVFDRHHAKFVNFVEVSEFEQIERHATDQAIARVRQQIKNLYQDGYETALHLHPQWTNAQYRGGQWHLDNSEYNLCTLARSRIEEIVDRGLQYLRNVVDDSRFSPVSFRAGNWLFQPTQTAASVLATRGVKIDSSVFKGGVQHAHQLDYRPALKNGYFWNFKDDVNEDTSGGPLLEIPIHVQMVPFWRMLTGKRVALQKKTETAVSESSSRLAASRINRLRDYLRPLYPLKFDFCRMTLAEMTSMIERVIRSDEKSSGDMKPLVAIGHTKDLIDLEAVDQFLSYLEAKNIPVSTLESVYARCRT